VRSLAIVLATAPERGDLARAARLAHAARAAGVEVSLFAMDAGVAALAADRAALAALLDDDCEVVACALSAHVRGLREDDVGVLLGSQDDHAAMVHRADRTVAFT
jgi:sulfur relay (sulfurtransferase) complex TusBCD TusD component (DsrE family)